jgi:hypothetical protein
MNENQLKYTSRDYVSIKSDLTDAINAVTSNWTSREESDPGIMLLNLMAYLGDNLSFNMDMQAIEMYLPTVTQRKNIKKILALIGYKVHWYRSALVDVTINNNSVSDIMLDLNVFSDNANNRLITFTGNNNYVLLPPSPNTVGSENYITISSYDSKTLTAIQGSFTNILINGSSINNNRFYLPDTNVDESHLYLYQVLPNSDTATNLYNDTILTSWELVDDISTQTESGNFFEFNTDEYDRPYIQFPTYWKSKISTVSSDIVSFRLYYILSTGANGNINDNAFYTIFNTPTFIDTTVTSELNISITNQNNWTSTTGNNHIGYDPQTTDDARLDAKNYMNTYDTLVTISDFEKFIKQHSGFNASLAIDVQRAKDLNMIIYENNLAQSTNAEDDRRLNALRIKQYVCGYGMLQDEYTESEIMDETDVPEYSYRKITQEDLINYVPEPINSSLLNEDTVETYHLNIYTIYQNYNTDFIGLTDSSDWNNPANPKITDTSDTIYPYRRYKISDEIINGTNGISGINSYLQNAKIMNVEVNFAICRVFDWRAVGTIYLRKPVIRDEADTIIENVVRALDEKFRPEYVGFGNKISYMDIIDTIQKTDSRIRYFDAGSNSKKLIDFSDCFDLDYFNPISIMRYNQYSVPNIYDATNINRVPQFNVDEEGNQLLVIDSASIIDL